MDLKCFYCEDFSIVFHIFFDVIVVGFCCVLLLFLAGYECLVFSLPPKFYVNLLILFIYFFFYDVIKNEKWCWFVIGAIKCHKEKVLLLMDGWVGGIWWWWSYKYNIVKVRIYKHWSESETVNTNKNDMKITTIEKQKSNVHSIIYNVFSFGRPQIFFASLVIYMESLFVWCTCKCCQWWHKPHKMLKFFIDNKIACCLNKYSVVWVQCFWSTFFHNVSIYGAWKENTEKKWILFL